MQTVRYVVLHHTAIAEPHFDVMIESHPGGPLLTWRAPHWPIEAPTPFVALGDHRNHYLTYEGEVSNGRGTVSRVAGGSCEVTTPDASQLIVRFNDGQCLNLVIAAGTRWTALPV
jgi:hypothetical protein